MSELIVDKKKNIIGQIIAMVSGLIFIYIASSWTSPLFKGSYGYDSAFFSMAGRAINCGKVMYRDYFDVKGPVFFFWEALGQRFFRDRMGIFFLQCICILGTTSFLYKICRLYKLEWKKIIFVFIIFYFIFATTLWGGNSVEEYCLPLNLACIYGGLKFLKRLDDTIDVAFFFGFTFGICFFSKMTVCAPMAAITIVVLARLIEEKRIKDIFKCIVLFILGIVVVAVPVFVYFIANNALDDMLLCAFDVAFARGTDFYEGFSVKWELYLTSCYAGILYFIFKVKEKGEDKWILLSLTLVTYAALHLGTPFDYYFTTTLPLVSYICILMGDDIKKIYNNTEDLKKLQKIIRCVVISLIGIFVICGAYFERTRNKIEENYNIAVNESEMQFYNDCIEIYELIPEDEREDLFCIESGMIFYEVNQILPKSKYPVNMPYFCELYPPAEDWIIDILDNHTPKWLVAEDIDEVDNDNIKDAVYRHYEKIYNNSMDELWRRID